jgi:hypothetical protein
MNPSLQKISVKTAQKILKLTGKASMIAGTGY